MKMIEERKLNLENRIMWLEDMIKQSESKDDRRAFKFYLIRKAEAEEELEFLSKLEKEMQ